MLSEKKKKVSMENGYLLLPGNKSLEKCFSEKTNIVYPNLFLKQLLRFLSTVFHYFYKRIIAECCMLRTIILMVLFPKKLNRIFFIGNKTDTLIVDSIYSQEA